MSAWDVFGNGKTALKVNAGRYMDPASNLSGNYSISNPIARIATTTSRTWVDNGANGGIANDNVPQCNFTNSAANGECGGMASPTFGTATRTTAAIDPNLINGWGIRQNDWQIGVSVQQQLVPKVSIEIGYFRRWLGNFTATDNTSLSAADFTPFTLTAPSDPRLPGGGGYAVTGLTNITAAGFARPATNNITDAANFGTEYSKYNGVLFNVTVRPVNGLSFQGGINSGKTVQDICAVTAQLPELTIAAVGNGVAPLVGPTNPYCHTDPGFITKITGIGSYVVPKIDVLIAGTVRSDQGAPLRATWNVPLATISQALGRPAVAAGTTIATDIVAPGQVWGDRVNELDFRFGKILKFGRMRTNVGIDIFNVLNQAAVLTYNQTYNPDRPVAGTAVGADAPLLQDQRADRLLESRLERQGGGEQKFAAPFFCTARSRRSAGLQACHFLLLSSNRPFPRRREFPDDLIHADAVLHLREHERARRRACASRRAPSRPGRRRRAGRGRSC